VRIRINLGFLKIFTETSKRQIRVLIAVMIFILEWRALELGLDTVVFATAIGALLALAGVKSIEEVEKKMINNRRRKRAGRCNCLA